MTRRNRIAVAALAGLLAAAPVYASYRRALRRAWTRLAGSEIARTRCGAIEYAIAGDGPPVLFVHGAGGGFDQGLAFGRDLVAAGFRLIAMSRFGYLRTTSPSKSSTSSTICPA